MTSRNEYLKYTIGPEGLSGQWSKSRDASTQSKENIGFTIQTDVLSKKMPEISKYISTESQDQTVFTELQDQTREQPDSTKRNDIPNVFSYQTLPLSSIASSNESTVDALRQSTAADDTSLNMDSTLLGVIKSDRVNAKEEINTTPEILNNPKYTSTEKYRFDVGSGSAIYSTTHLGKITALPGLSQTSSNVSTRAATNMPNQSISSSRLAMESKPEKTIYDQTTRENYGTSNISTEILHTINANLSTIPEHITNIYTKSHYLSSNKEGMPSAMWQSSKELITDNAGSPNMTTIASHLIYSVSQGSTDGRSSTLSKFSKHKNRSVAYNDLSTSGLSVGKHDWTPSINQSNNYTRKPGTATSTDRPTDTYQTSTTTHQNMNRPISFPPIKTTSNISDRHGAEDDTKGKSADAISTMAIVTPGFQDNLFESHPILSSSSFDVTKPLSDMAYTNEKDVLSGTNTMQTSQKYSNISTANGKYVTIIYEQIFQIIYIILDVRCIWHQFLTCANSFRICFFVESFHVTNMASSLMYIIDPINRSS